MKLTVIFLVAFNCMMAEDVKKEETPKIDPSHLAEYYRADGMVTKLQATIQAYQDQLKDAQKDLQDAVSVLQKDCGATYVPNNVTTKQIGCIAKPEEKKPEEKK